MRSLALLSLLSFSVVSSADPIDDLVKKEMSAQRIPGLAIAVIRNGKPFKVKGYGFANLEHKVPVTANTIFQLGSVGKQFTSALAMKLVEQGKLKLDDEISQFLPESKGKWKGVTIRHLLGHVSGLPDLPYHTMDMRKDYTEAELVEFMAGQAIPEKPGAKWRYNNGGYVMLGVILGRVGKRFYGDQLGDLILKPLGMKATRIISESDLILNRAAGYEKVGTGWKNQGWVAPKLNTTADGSLYTSLNDMIVWDKALTAGKFLRKDLLEMCWTSGKLNDGKETGYGFGWGIALEGGSRIASHSGAWQGFTAHIERNLDRGVTVIVLTNTAGCNPSKIAKEAMKIGLKG